MLPEVQNMQGECLLPRSLHSLMQLPLRVICLPFSWLALLLHLPLPTWLEM